MEAIYRDYGPKKVRFFFIYKTLAHPELSGNLVQPFTLQERLIHAKNAQAQLGSTIPWLVDAADNRLKHALGDRPNSEFVIDPEGKVARKRAWSHPAQLRKDLEALAGPSPTTTSEDDIRLAIKPPPKSPAERGVVPRLKRPRMQPIVMEPVIEKGGAPFFAKLRAEADGPLLNSGKGKLYLGFHLDPIHDAHWNHLNEPLSFQLIPPKSASFPTTTGSGPKLAAGSDCDPREFLVDVENWPESTNLEVVVRYSACVGEIECHTVSQKYILRRKRDIDGGGARGDGAGFWNPAEFAEQAMAGDKNEDGKLDRTEVRGLVLPFFDKLDRNRDGFLDEKEIEEVARWLNTHHLPMSPGNPPKPEK